MDAVSIGVANSQATLISDDVYANTIIALIEKAQIRILASVFIVDTMDRKGVEPKVPYIITRLSYARRRGLDVRIIVGGSTDNIAIQDSTTAAMELFHFFKVPARLGARPSGAGYSSHKKVVVLDDDVLIGSHNWSNGALSCQTQDSIWVHDERLAAHFAQCLKTDWQKLRR
jgi:phosphatidylserine/phosphatidylglycerophosphate/cardiolipin synthase-like enzyme